MKKLALIFILTVTVITVNSQESNINPPPQSQQTLVVVADSLYHGYDYNYYKQLYKKAVKHQNIGIAFTVLGGACIVGGYAIMTNSFNNWQESGYTNSGKGIGFTIFVSGMAMLPIGLTKSLVWSSKKRKAYKAMGEINPQLKFSFGATGNGVSLIVSL